jgi:lipid-binding SYLF domain-containing protein
LEDFAMRTLLLPVLMVVAGGLLGCETSAPTPTEQAAMRDDAKASLERMEAQDPTLKLLVDNSYGYAILPEVGEGAVGIGGASGDGVVYNKGGQRMGTVRLSQASVGIALGGQTFAELIIFQDEKSFNRILNDSIEFGADASATLVKAGAADAGNFAKGVQIYILPKGGLMAGVSLNGQKFHYTAWGTQTNQ